MSLPFSSVLLSVTVKKRTRNILNTSESVSISFYQRVTLIWLFWGLFVVVFFKKGGQILTWLTWLAKQKVFVWIPSSGDLRKLATMKRWQQKLRSTFIWKGKCNADLTERRTLNGTSAYFASSCSLPSAILSTLVCGNLRCLRLHGQNHKKTNAGSHTYGDIVQRRRHSMTTTPRRWL